jgi:hypothetical protein
MLKTNKITFSAKNKVIDDFEDEDKISEGLSSSDDDLPKVRGVHHLYQVSNIKIDRS